MTTFWLSVAALAVVLVGTGVLICAAHIPGLREWTGAEPLEPEPPAAEPPPAPPVAPPPPRVADRPCDIPHGFTRRTL